MKPTRFFTAVATTLAATTALTAPATAVAPPDSSADATLASTETTTTTTEPAATSTEAATSIPPATSAAPTESTDPTSSTVAPVDPTPAPSSSDSPTSATLPTSTGTEAPTTIPESPPPSATTTTTPATPDGAVVDPGATVPVERDTVPPETVPEETTTTTTIPVSVPPVNPIWLQTGARRATANGEPGAVTPQAGRTPVGKRLPAVDEIDIVLATIRTLESANQYGIGPNKASASGAYQYIRSTWNGYGGYPDAYLAPAEMQDARARADVEFFLQRYNGNVSMIPIMWYYPRAATDTSWMDRVPNPAGGNRLTVREYQTKWLNLYQAYYDAYVETYTPPPEVGMASVVSSDARVVDPLAGSEPGTVAVMLNDGTTDQATMSWAARAAIPTMQPAPADGSYRSIVFPVLGPVTYEDGWGACRDACTRQHVGTDIIGVQMQPLLAAVDGTITRISPVATGISGVAISITGPDGWRYNYFHVNNDTPGTDDGAALQAWEIAPGLQVGSTVRAGQIIGYMGNSGNAEASVTHLHFEIRDPAGVAQPSYASLKAAESAQACSVAIGPWSTPTLGPDATDNAEAQALVEAFPDAAPVASAEVALGPDGLPVTAPTPGYPGATLTEAPEFVDPTTGTASPTAPVAHFDPMAPLSPATTPVGADGVQHPQLASTVVTPLFGSGQWTIDTDGRVTATGDAALIIPGRDLPCADGPAAPFGTDAAGWIPEPDDAVLQGTTLDGVDLTGTVLQGVLPAATTQLVPASAGQPNPLDMLGLSTAAMPTDQPAYPYAAHAFRLPATGETVLLLFPDFSTTPA